MRPNYIILKNYRSYGDKETKLFLDGNSARILMGKNGAGKTTFIDAMMWCMFGRCASNVDKIVNRKTKKNTKVEFSFNINSDEYSVIRYRNDEKYGEEIFLFKNKDNITQTKKKDTQNLIQEIIGVSYNTIINSIVFSKETFNPFLSETPAKRLAVLDSILNLKPIAVWGEEIKLQKGKIESDLIEIKNKIEKCNFGIETITSSIEKYKEEKSNKLLELKKEFEINIKSIKSYREELEEIVKIDITKEKENNLLYKSLIQENEKVYKNIIEEEKRLKDVDEELIEYNKNRIRLSEIEKIDIDKELKILEKYEKEVRHNLDVDKEIELLKAKLKNEKSINLDSIEKEIGKLEKEKEKTESNICHTCGQILNKDLSTEILEKTNKSIILKKEELEKKTEELNDLKDFNEKIEFDLEELKKTKIEIGEKPQLNKEELLRNKEIINTLKTKIKVSESVIENSNKDNAVINEKIKNLRKDIKEITIKENYEDEFLNNLDKEIMIANSGIENLNSKNEVIEKEIKKLLKDNSLVEESENKIRILSEEVEKITAIRKRMK
jgi:exonuclease SbcC